jgi:uncharacterized protein YndB with AHSA1/START domain
MPARNDPAAVTATREVTLTRTFNAPRAVVFRAWTDPKHMANWWGPHHFTNPVCELDVRPGGRIYIVMRAPDGTEYPMRGEFREVVEPERLVFFSYAEDRDGTVHLESLTTVTFADQDGKTLLTVHANAVGFTPQAPMMLGGMELGWTQSLDRLAAVVSQLD